MDKKLNVGIVGMGMIGCSMAVLTTGHGCKTVCLVRDMGKCGAYEERYGEYFAQMLRHGIVSERTAEVCRKYLSFSESYEELAACEVIFECAAEKLEVKRAIYAEIEKHCPNVRAICSVSSSIVADELASKAPVYGDRIIVTHPFNPAHMVPYFEICAGEKTAQGVTDFAADFLRLLDRRPVVLKKPAPGFIGNRLQFALWREALNIVDSGIADAKDVDDCLMYSFCPRYTSIGIFEHFDGGGLPLCKATCDSVFPSLSNAEKTPECIEQRIARGDTGQKAGEGFYDWRGVDMEAYAERVSAPYWRFMDWDFPTE